MCTVAQHFFSIHFSVDGNKKITGLYEAATQSKPPIKFATRGQLRAEQTPTDGQYGCLTTNADAPFVPNLRAVTGRRLERVGFASKASVRIV